jgi:hypothetical protein
MRSLTSGKRARILVAAAVAAAFACLPAASARLQAQQSIQMFLSAVDGEGKPVTDLKAEDVNVLVDGAACTTAKFEAIDWPVKLTLMVDNGPVHSDALRQLREALRLFIAELPTDMEVSILSTDPAPRFIYKAGADRAKMLSSIDLITPDSGAPRFIDALTEAADRINKDKTDKNKEKGNYFPVMMMIGSSGIEGSGPQAYQLSKLFKQVSDNAVTVHIVLQSGKLSDPVSGANLIEISLRLTKMTGGRYDSINSETRLSTLLPEFGRQIAKSHVRQSHQYRITCRPTGGGAPQRIDANVKRPNVSAALTLDGRIP